MTFLTSSGSSTPISLPRKPRKIASKTKSPLLVFSPPRYSRPDRPPLEELVRRRHEVLKGGGRSRARRHPVAGQSSDIEPARFHEPTPPHAPVAFGGCSPPSGLPGASGGASTGAVPCATPTLPAEVRDAHSQQRPARLHGQSPVDDGRGCGPGTSRTAVSVPRERPSPRTARPSAPPSRPCRGGPSPPSDSIASGAGGRRSPRPRHVPSTAPACQPPKLEVDKLPASPGAVGVAAALDCLDACHQHDTQQLAYPAPGERISELTRSRFSGFACLTSEQPASQSICARSLSLSLIWVPASVNHGPDSQSIDEETKGRYPTSRFIIRVPR